MSEAIEQKLRHVLSVDDTGGRMIGAGNRHPAWAKDIQLTETEMDLRDWGTIYGAAFALCREENAWEPTQRVTTRAIEIAWRVYRDWGTEITRPDRKTPEEVVLTADQRAAFMAEVDVYSDDCSPSTFIAEFGPLLGLVEQMHELREDRSPRTVTLPDPDVHPSAVRLFLEYVAREIEHVVATEVLTDETVERERTRLAAIEDIRKAVRV